LFHLTATDARQTLDVIRSAHGAPESAPSPTEPDLAAPSPPTPLQEANTSQHHPAHLRVLGPPTLSAGSSELSTGIRGKARELLTFLAVHSDGTSRDAILEALWPDIDQRHAVMRFHAAVNDVRRELRRASGLTDQSFITVVADRYRIDAELVGVDLWHFRTALHKASRAPDDRIRAGLLQNALDAYKGELAAQQPYEWIEPEREALRRLAVEALIQLASLHEPDEPEQALAALERARSLDQYGEEIYQRIMVLQARLNRPDAVRRTFRLLETALEELDADPSEETRQLLWRLKIPRAKHQSEPRRH
jgi:DNA-binding SARP family transcriptional activator